MRIYHQKKLEQKPRYPEDPWKIIEKKFSVKDNHHNETIFALGNGFMGVRGVLEEGYSGPPETSSPGVFINGFYDSEDFIYGEEVPGDPDYTQTLVNLPDWTVIRAEVDGEQLDMLKSKIYDYRRALDMKRGVLEREFKWETREGKILEVKISRLVSFINRHAGMIRWQARPLNFSGEIKLNSELVGSVENAHKFRLKKRLALVDKGWDEDILFLLQRTRKTRFKTGWAAAHNVQGEVIEAEKTDMGERVGFSYRIKLEKGKEFVLDKLVAGYSNLELSRGRVKTAAIKGATRIQERGFSYYLQGQEKFLQDFWKDVDIEIQGAPRIQQGIRFNKFHLLQSCPVDGRTSIAAKGLTGEYYEGHYFWDVDMYIVPFFAFNKPSYARRLLMYRYSVLEAARHNARRFKNKGALFAWRTINGEEASGYFMGSSVQCHINADIVYAIKQYLEITGDRQFLYNYGAEIIFETARFWCDRGNYNPHRDSVFCITEVCGPDEYKPGVNNNCFTNYMACFNLLYAVRISEEMARENPAKLAEIKHSIGLVDEEIEEWKRVADCIDLPFYEELGIHPQDDSFLCKKEIDVDSIPLEEIPLVRYWHPLTIWRYQIIKQADVVLLMILLGDQFTLEQKKANFDFYEPRTIHDSSLSPAIYSILASEIGEYSFAYNYFTQTVRLDLDDFNENAYQGIHAACMGSSWMAITMGFAGMRNYEGKLHFAPYLPDGWEGYCFKVRFQGRVIEIRVNREVSYRLLKGKPITIYHNGNPLKLKKEGAKKEAKIVAGEKELF